MGTRHLKKLWPSSEGHREFVDAILDRYEELRTQHLRLRGSLLEPPPDLRSEWRRFHTLMARWAQDDWRHSASEIQACQAIAQWTLDVHREINNLPIKKIAWQEGDQFSG